MRAILNDDGIIIYGVYDIYDVYDLYNVYNEQISNKYFVDLLYALLETRYGHGLGLQLGDERGQMWR